MGRSSFRDWLLYLASAMVDRPIGLGETDDGIWTIWVTGIALAAFGEHDRIIRG